VRVIDRCFVATLLVRTMPAEGGLAKWLGVASHPYSYTEWNSGRFDFKDPLPPGQFYVWAGPSGRHLAGDKGADLTLRKQSDEFYAITAWLVQMRGTNVYHVIISLHSVIVQSQYGSLYGV